MRLLTESELAMNHARQSFDAYISLGDNCEPGLQFRRIGYEESSIFRITVIDSDQLICLLKSDFKNLFLKENLKPASVDHMVIDQLTGVAFHSKLYSTIDENSGLRVFRSDYDFDEVYRQEKKKVDYLVEKWRQLVASKKKVLYFRKRNYSPGREDAEAILQTFNDCYPGHDFLILYLQPRDRAEPDWGHARLRNIYLDHLAPYDDAEAGADRKGWDRIFHDYPLRQPRQGLLQRLKTRFSRERD
jgi:hypothetical protein